MTSNSQPPVICLMGPTASGKTALGVHLAQAIKGEIISVDSALVYRGMDVGTAKPSLAERGGVPHHLIDILDPTEAYSTGQFREQALGHIDDIIKRGRQPILVGGTMLYFSALTQGLAQLPAADTALRQRLDEEAQRFGNLHMHEKLRQIDPESAQRIHVNDPQRVQRALEVFELSGQPLSQLVKQAEPNRLPYRFIKLVVMPEARLTLHQRIEQRVDHMLSLGLVAEVEALRLRGDLNLEMPSMRCVGYRQVWSYLDGEYDYPTMRDKVLFATRQLAKRQLTWLRKESDASILYSDAHDINQQLLAFIKSCLNH